MLKFSKLVALSILLCSQAGLAQEHRVTSEELAHLQNMLKTPDAFKGISAIEVAKSKLELKNSMRELERQLNLGETSQSQAWKQYLHWDLLTAEMQNEKPRRSELIKIYYQFQLNHPGLELSVFTDVRKALYQFMNRSFFSETKTANLYYTRRLATVKSALAKLATTPDDTTIALLGEAILDLENAGQCLGLVNEIRRVFSKPNLQIEISETLVQRIASKQSQMDTRPVNEVILGVMQCGTANTTANISVAFVPSQSTGKFAVAVDGETISDQVGTKDIGFLGAIKICSQGHTSLQANTTLEFDGQQLNYTELKGDAKTNTEILGVDTPPFIRGMVLKQVKKQTPRGEKIAAERAREKFLGSINEQLSTAVENVNENMTQKVATPAKRLNFEPRYFQVNTTEDLLAVTGLIGSSKQLSGISGPKPGGGNDFSMQIHESAINNALQHLFGGRSISNSELRQLIASFGVAVPDQGKDEKEVTITFPRVRPILVQFNQNNVEIIISADRLKQGTTEIKDKLKISATYQLETMPTLIKAARAGEIKLDFAGTYTNAKAALEANIKPKLAELFPEKMDDIDLSSLELAPELTNIGLPKIANFSLENGWMAIGFNLSHSQNNVDSKTSPTAVSAVKPALFKQLPTVSSARGTVVHISDSSFRISDVR